MAGVCQNSLREIVMSEIWKPMAEFALTNKELTNRFENDGISAAGKYFLDRMNIEIDYKQKNNPEINCWRDKLNTQPGLVICNHPGYVEIPGILQNIHRQDFKAMVTAKLYESFTKSFGEKYFIPAYKNITELRKALVDIKEHIEAGGLFMIFPSGGDKEDGHDITFNHGFRSILGNLKSDDMVYAYNVNVEQAIELRNNKIKNFVGLASDILTHEFINPNGIGNPKVVEMDEIYTQAETWQSIIRQSRSQGLKPELNLTEYYKKIFSTDKQE